MERSLVSVSADLTAQCWGVFLQIAASGGGVAGGVGSVGCALDR